MAKTKHDWSVIRQEYVGSPETISKTDLAKKYGINSDYLIRKAKKEGWSLQRDLHIARDEEQTLEKLEGVISDEGAKFDSEMFFRIKSLLVRMDTDIKGAISDKVVQAYSDVFRALTLAQGVGKAALGDKGDNSSVAVFMVALETATKKKATIEPR
jgi:hypothetical protein